MLVLLVGVKSGGTEEKAFSKPPTAIDGAVNTQQLERKKSSKAVNKPWAGRVTLVSSLPAQLRCKY